MKGAPRSKQFDDVYFSADNGLAETHHVFVQGNNLPHAWQGADQFTIVETGFGTGLNFLSVWKLFEQTADPGAQLDFVSFEKYPLEKDFILKSLKPFHEVRTYLDRFLHHYPLLTPGFHRIVLSDHVRLTLIFDDINEAMPQLEAKADCWFLDGFTPAKNPDMWSETVFRNMGRLSKPGATFATFTAAGFVRRGLEEAGFTVEKTEGFGRKRDMIKGHYEGTFSHTKRKPQKIAIIGAGLSGTSCAHILRQRGFDPVIYEAGEKVGAGASGNSLGLFNPRFCAHRNGDSDFYTAAFAQFLRTATLFEDIDYNPVGALHLINTPEKEKRFQSLRETWGWPGGVLDIVDADQASEIAGVQIERSALYLPHSGYVSPHKICKAYAQDTDIRYGQRIETFDEIEADIIILAGGADMKKFIPWLPVHFVRGQVTTIETPEELKNLKCNIHYGGYISASRNGQNRIGATFQKWIDHTDVVQEDHADNIQKLKDNLSVRSDPNVLTGWAGLRTASKDRFPIVGGVPGMHNVYISTGHASHGLVSSLAAAHLLADMICNTPCSLPKQSISELAPQRFIERATKKGEVLEGFTAWASI